MLLEEELNLDKGSTKVIKGEAWQIVGTFIECFANSDKVLLSQDHDKYVWINPEDYLNYNLHEGLNSTFKKYLNRTSN